MWPDIKSRETYANIVEMTFRYNNIIVGDWRHMHIVYNI